MDGIREGLTCICLVGAAVSTVAWAAMKLRMENVKCRMKNCPQFSILHSKFSIHTAVFLFFAAIATVCAQKSGTNGLMRTTENVETAVAGTEDGCRRRPEGLLQPTFRVAEGASVPSVVEMFRLESESTNETYAFSMPTNGIRYDNWWKRGAYEDVFRLDLGGMAFPLNGELLDSLWVYSWGMAGAHLGNASNRLVATGVPMSAVPGRSQFWSSDATNGARLLTWENFFLNRDTNTPVSAQLELYSTGDFVARSNNVERLYRRVNPDDWDDDGIPNDEDQDPYVNDGDFFGPRQELRQGANSNAYYWVDIVVSNASSLVTFTGDGASALPDPSFVARPGETNRVELLIGKTYNATSRMPMACVGRSSLEIETWQDSPTKLSIRWPVTIATVAMRDGLSFSMSVTPDCLGGGFTWTNSCCSISSSENSFTYSCDENCHCTGCCALGCYTYEGFSLPASGGSCGCSAIDWPDSGTVEEEDDGPYAGGASATFTKSAIIFEDPYENTPGSWVGRHSTTTELHCVAHGGPNGGHVRFEVLGAARLNSLSGTSLPLERDVSAGKKVEFSVIYEGVAPSESADDIVATATFTENTEGAEPVAMSNSLTSVKVELTAVYVAPENPCSHRHVYGVGEKVNCCHEPSDMVVTWSLTSHEYDNLIVDASACDNEITFSHLAQCAPGIRVSCLDADHYIQYTLIEPTDVIAYSAIWDGECLPCGRAGGFGMKMRMYVYPMHVSFQGIDMVEVPCSVVVPPIGYYNTTNFTGYLSHTLEAGAGYWHHVKSGNYWSEDHASSGERYGPWSGGMLVWNIPIAWNYRYDDPSDSWPNGHYASTCRKIGGSDATFQQVFFIDAEGLITIEKFDHVVERGTNDVIFVDDVLVHGGGH